MTHKNVAFVSMEDEDAATKFRDRLRSPHTFICDPERRLYEAFGLPRASTRQLFSPRTAVGGIVLLARGYGMGRATSDPSQLGGAFLIKTGGEVRWRKRFESAAEILSRSRAEGLLEPKS